MNQIEQMQNTIDQMQKTVAGFVNVLKVYKQEIEALKYDVKELKQFRDSLPEPNPEQQLLDRYTVSSKTNRSINEPPKVVAYAAHLYYICNVPAVRISECGILSQSKMYGLTTWDNQHLLDYCDLNHVREVYEHGLSVDEIKEIVDNYDLLQSYLSRKN